MPRKGRAPGRGSCGPDPSPACTDGLAPPGGQAKAPREMLTWARDQDGHPDAPWGARWGGGRVVRTSGGAAPPPFPPGACMGGGSLPLPVQGAGFVRARPPPAAHPAAAPPSLQLWAGQRPPLGGAAGQVRPRTKGPRAPGADRVVLAARRERERDIPGRSGDNTDSGGGAGRGGGGGVQAPVAQGSSGAKLSRKETHISQVSLAGPTAGAGMVAASGRHPPWSPAR